MSTYTAESLKAISLAELARAPSKYLSISAINKKQRAKFFEEFEASNENLHQRKQVLKAIVERVGCKKSRSFIGTALKEHKTFLNGIPDADILVDRLINANNPCNLKIDDIDDFNAKFAGAGAFQIYQFLETNAKHPGLNDFITKYFIQSACVFGASQVFKAGLRKGINSKGEFVLHLSDEVKQAIRDKVAQSPEGLKIFFTKEGRAYFDNPDPNQTPKPPAYHVHSAKARLLNPKVASMEVEYPEFTGEQGVLVLKMYEQSITLSNLCGQHIKELDCLHVEYKADDGHEPRFKATVEKFVTSYSQWLAEQENLLAQLRTFCGDSLSAAAASAQSQPQRELIQLDERLAVHRETDSNLQKWLRDINARNICNPDNPQGFRSYIKQTNEFFQTVKGNVDDLAGVQFSIKGDVSLASLVKADGVGLYDARGDVQLALSSVGAPSRE